MISPRFNLCLGIFLVFTGLLAASDANLSTLDISKPKEISAIFNPFKVNKALKINAFGPTTSGMYTTRAVSLPGPGKSWNPVTAITGAPDGAGADIFGFNVGDQSDPLLVKDYNFNIPCNAIIDSVTVILHRRNESASGSDVSDVEARLWLPDLNPSPMDLADPTPWLESTTMWEQKIYKHENWGEVLTPEIINDVDFGFIYTIQNDDPVNSASVALDAVEIIVCYTLIGGSAYANPITYTSVKMNACGNMGSITFTAMGGSGDYEYSITNGASWQTSPSFTGLATGDYEVLVRGTDGTCTTQVMYCSLNADERILQPGDAIIACKSDGPSDPTLAIENIQPLYDLYNAGVVGTDVSPNLHPHPYEWTTGDLGGDVFSVSVDQDWNIYTGASSMYNLVGSTNARVSKIDGLTGIASTLTTLPGNKGIGGVEYDTICEQLFVANLDDGMIYRLDPVTGGTLSTFNPLGGDHSAPGLAPLGERVVSVVFNYADSRLYYSMWNSDANLSGIRNTIRSISINPTTCDFVSGSDQLEISLPWLSEYGDPTNDAYSMPVTDIEFSQDGATMLLAESGFDSNVPAAVAHESRFIRYTGASTSWNLQSTPPAGNTYYEYEVGAIANGANSRGGIDFASAGMVGLCSNDNEQFIIGTGDALRGTSCNVYGCIYGVQFMPVTGGNPLSSVLVDVGRDQTSQQKFVFGDLDVIQGCRASLFCGTYDLALTKTITSTGPYSAGDNVTFTISVTNQGNTDANGIVVTDNSSADLIYQSMVVNGNLVDNGDETFTIASLPAMGSQDIVVTYQISPTFTGTSTPNNAQITTDDGDDIDSDPATDYTVDEDGDLDPFDDDEAVVIVPVEQSYDLALTKAITSTGPYASGDNVTFTITVTNQGTLPAAGIIVTDNSDANLLYQSMVADANVVDNGDETFTIGSLGSLATQDIVVTYQISPTFTGTSIDNLAQITTDDGDDIDSNPATDYTVDEDSDLDPFDDDEDIITVPVGQSYDLALTKATTSAGPYGSGDNVTFTITVTNQGTLPAAGIIVTDNSDVNLLYQSMVADANVVDNGDETFTISSLASLATQDIVVTYQISPSFTGTSIDNLAQITTDDGDDVDSNPATDYTVDEDSDLDPFDDDEDIVTVPVGQSYDLALAKAITSTGPYGSGDNVTFTITVTNQGTLPAAGVIVTDNSDADLIYQSMVADANVVDNGDETFTIGSLASLATQDILVTYQISPSFTGTSIDNLAQITTDDGDDIDSNPATDYTVDEDSDLDPFDDDEDVVTVPVGQNYDLALAKAITSTGPYGSGDNVTFTITVTNQGTLPAAGVIVTDNSDANLIYQSMVADANVVDNGDETFTIGSLASLVTQDIVVTYQISPSFTGTSLDNLAQITTDDGDDIDSDPATDYTVDEDSDLDPFDDDEDVVTVPVGQNYDLALAKAITSTGPYGAGDNVTFTITVTNEGTLPAAGIIVTDNSDANLIYQSMVADGNVVDNGDETFTISSLASLATQDIMVTYQISPSFTGTSLDNLAQITTDDGDDIDSDPATDYTVDEDSDLDPFDDDEDVVTVPVGQNYDLALAKAITSTGPYGAGDNVTFTITVTNEGTLPAGGIIVTDNSDANLIYQSMVADGNVVDNGDETFTIGSLASLATQDIVVTYQISPSFTGTSLDNLAQITTDDDDDIDSDPTQDYTVDEDGDLDPFDDDEDIVTVPVGQTYDLALSKAITSTGPYGAGDNVTFTITVTNEGTLPAAAIIVTDNSDANLIYQSMVADANVVDNGDETFSIGSLASLATQDIVVIYQISPSFTGTSLDNLAQITTDDDDDIDSDPTQDYTLDEDGDLDPFDDDEDIVTVPVGQTYDLALSKAITSTGPYASGDNVTFTITVTNQGTLPASGIVVTDNSDANLIFQNMVLDANVADNGNETFTIGSLASLASQDIIVTYQISPSFMGSNIDNLAQITTDDGDDIDSDPMQDYTVDEDGDLNPFDDDEDIVTVNIGQVYDLALTKSITSTGPYSAGSPVTFTITVVNEGTLDATNVIVTDNSPTDLIFQSMNGAPNITDNTNETFTISSLPANTQQEIVLNYMISPTFMGTVLTNGAQITTDDGDDVDSDPDQDYTVDEDGDMDPDDDDEDEVDVPVGQVYDLSLTKIVTSTGPYGPGSTVTFNIAVTNEGTIDASGIEVTDNSGPGLSYVSMAPNANITASGAGVFVIASIPANTTETIMVSYQVDANFMGTTLRNDAEITADDGDDVDSDPDTGDDVDEDGDGDPDDDDEDGLDIPVNQVYDLALTKTIISSGPYGPGSVITFNITVINEGTIDANNIVVTDMSSIGLNYVSMGANTNVTDNGNETFTITNIPVNGTEVIELNYQVDPTFMGTALRNDAQITADDGDDEDSDPDTGDDVDEDGDGDPDDDDEDGVDVPVGQVYDLALTKTIVSAGPYSPGSTISFEITVINEGTLNASNIVVSDISGPDLTFVSMDPVAGVNNNGNETFTFLNIPAGTSQAITLNYMIPANFMGTSLSNDAQIISDDGDDEDSDPDTGDDVDEDGDGDPDDDDEDGVDFPVTQVYDLALIKEIIDDRVYYEGEDVPFRITVFNQGSIDANNVEIVDYVPDGLSLSLTDANGWGVSMTGSGVSAIHSNTIGFIPAGGQATVDISLTINTVPAGGGSFTNWAEVSVDDGDDVDSTPDQVNTDPYGGDNIVDNTGGDEDDHDAAIVVADEQRGALGDLVWEDLNGNGIQDGGEPGIEGLIVRLYSGTGLLLDITTTDNNGNYLFDNLDPGFYYIEFVSPEDYDLTFTAQGGDGGADSDIDHSNGLGTTPLIHLSTQEVDLTWDAGFYRCTQVGELVWYDRNENDMFDEATENGINGLRVEIYREVNGTYVYWDREFTGAKPNTASDDGYFKFCVPPGSYYLKVIVPNTGLVPVRPGVGSATTDSDFTDAFGPNTTGSFVVGSEDLCEFAAGFYPMASVGDLVWLDNNANGIKETGESTMSGIKVEAYNIYNDKVGEATTDGDGTYEIDYLRKENYFLKFYPPAGYSMTVPNAQLDDASDSDVTHANGPNTTSFYEMNPGDHITNIDAGLITGSILPVQLLGFSAQYRSDFVHLDWKTSSEINTAYFVVERRYEDETPFASIGRQAAAGTAFNYSLDDYDIDVDGTYYYRLKMVDNDGTEAYSDIISVDIDKERGEGVQIYPNPTVSTFNLELELEEEEQVVLNIFSSDGKLVSENVLNKKLQQGIHSVNVDVSKLSAGVYTAVIHRGYKIINKKLIILSN